MPNPHWKSLRNECFCYLDTRHHFKLSILHESAGGGRWWARLFARGEIVFETNMGGKLTEEKARQRACREIAKRLSGLSMAAIKCEEGVVERSGE